jgi:hypothetical protein
MVLRNRSFTFSLMRSVVRLKNGQPADEPFIPAKKVNLAFGVASLDEAIRQNKNPRERSDIISICRSFAGSTLAIRACGHANRQSGATTSIIAWQSMPTSFAT